MSTRLKDEVVASATNFKATDLPTDWRAGLEALRTMPSPTVDLSPACGRQLVDDALTVAEVWDATAG